MVLHLRGKSQMFSESMDNAPKEGDEPLSRYGSHSLKQSSHTQNVSTSHNRSPVQGRSSYVDTQPAESSMLYENLPEIEEPLYEDVPESTRTTNPAVEELINTESSYVHSLRLLTSQIQPKLEQIPDIDVKCLFSNLDEILLVHESFLRELTKTENYEQDQLTCIGNLFQEFSKDMENAYTIYCSGYTRAASLLKHYQETHVAGKINDVLIASSTHPDLSFYLVMPVQRITKYPLLLQQIQHTVHQDKDSQSALQNALDTMKEVNVNINENKRRKDVATKYLQSDQRTLREKVSFLNTHTISKKSQRLSQFLKQQAGVSPKKEDKEFDTLAERFQRLAAAVNQVEENVVSYVKNVQEFILIQPQTYPLEYLQETVHPFQGFSQELCNNVYTVFLPHSKVPEAQFRSWVEDSIQQSISQMNAFTQIFDEVVPSPIVQEQTPALERQIEQLLSRHGPTKLYQVVSNVKGSRDLELTLSRGAVVAVIQNADTKGNKNRWLVDAGGSRGYVACSKLQPYQVTQVPQSPSRAQHSPESNNTLRASKVCPYPTSPYHDTATAFQVVAGYSFTARSSYEVSIAEGEPVTLLEPHDKNGSPEWSLVEVSGHRGYVPSSYLVRIPVQDRNRRTSASNVVIPKRQSHDVSSQKSER
ncbi:rho guanine nucleotide exchange factor 37 isoform X3 [Pseudophryne corroboree]|uniref:rho guanine nucleotide exchange factor 37 isoform X3 n=1 Tax=Pseudophryne corroboree TaxID=495146 RepID=UPI003081E408